MGRKRMKTKKAKEKKNPNKQGSKIEGKNEGERKG